MSNAMARGVFLTAPGELEMRGFDLPEPASGEAVVRVAGCGLCHTDVGFYGGSVTPRHGLPLILGHEITGTVDSAPAPFGNLVGRDVVVPAVIPCDECDLCRSGHDNACGAQVMPGNDTHGGFATHVVVPARHLIPLGEERGGYSLAELAVIADAVTTPYQALQRAGVESGDVVIVIGVGGIGTYAVQLAAALGAHVAAVDIDPSKLERLRCFGAGWTFDARAIDARAVRTRLLEEASTNTARWRILEMSGTASGQEYASKLLPPAGTLGVIGFTMDRPSIRLSNLMALDATAFGSWGCSPSLYPAVLDLVTAGRVSLREFVEVHPIGRAPELFEQMHAPGGLARRAVLVPC